MKYLALFIFGLIFWLLITSSLSLPNITIGIIASLITMLFFGKTFIQTTNKLLHPQRYFWLIVYIIIFAWECLKANIDVAYRVLHPRMPIKPGIVKVKTHLKANLRARTGKKLVLLQEKVLLVVLLCYKRLLCVCFDEEFARAKGIRTEVYYLLLLCLIAAPVPLTTRLPALALGCGEHVAVAGPEEGSDTEAVPRQEKTAQRQPQKSASSDTERKTR